MRCQMLAALLDLCPAFGTWPDLQGDKCGWLPTKINKIIFLNRVSKLYTLAIKDYV